MDLLNPDSTPFFSAGCGVYGYYMAMAFGHIPCCEFMMMSDQADKILPNFGTLFKKEPLPKDGYISLPNTPGFGLELDKERLNLVRPFDRSTKSTDAGGDEGAPKSAKRSKP